MDKGQIRKSIKQELAGLALPPAALRPIYSLLSEFIKSLQPPRRLILAYAAHFPAEIDLMPLFAALEPGYKLFLPRVSPSGMCFYAQKEVPPLLEPGHRGVPEPSPLVSAEQFCPEQATEAIVLVPGLGFDVSGGRLGRGGGCYDRFLSGKEMNAAVTIGVCWDAQLMEELPLDPHDVRVQWICTPAGIFKAGICPPRMADG